jgi:hypothetical protein
LWEEERCWWSENAEKMTMAGLEEVWEEVWEEEEEEEEDAMEEAEGGRRCIHLPRTSNARCHSPELSRATRKHQTRQTISTKRQQRDALKRPWLFASKR